MTQSNTDNRIKFGLDKAVLGMLLTLAWPTILENLLETILQYVDTAMVGHLGAQATATVSLTATYTWLIQSVTGALGVGFLSYIARAVGEKDQSKIRKASRLAMIVALLAGGILMAITLWMAPHVPVWMGAEKAIHADATRYFIFINLPMIFRAGDHYICFCYPGDRRYQDTYDRQCLGQCYQYRAQLCLYLSFGKGGCGSRYGDPHGILYDRGSFDDGRIPAQSQTGCAGEGGIPGAGERR